MKLLRKSQNVPLLSVSPCLVFIAAITSIGKKLVNSVHLMNGKIRRDEMRLGLLLNPCVSLSYNFVNVSYKLLVYIDALLTHFLCT